MLSYLLKRLAEAVPTLLIIATLTFFIVRLAPGDPFSNEKASTPEVMDAKRAHFNMVDPKVGWTGLSVENSRVGLTVTKVALHSPAMRAELKTEDVVKSLNGKEIASSEEFERQTAGLAPGTEVKLGIRKQEGATLETTVKLAARPTSIFTQFIAFCTKALQGDFGPSQTYPGWTVSELIFAKFPASLELGLSALFVAVLLGVSTGVLAAWKPNTATDYLPMSASMLGICLPAFVLGPSISLILALKFNLFNSTGWFTSSDRVLPTLTLGLGLAALLARLTRGSMLEVRNQDYMRTARAKGLSEARVMLGHGLRNGLLPVVAYLGPAAAGLVSGSFVTEQLFNVPGLGKFFVTSALNKDMPIVMGTTLFFATLLLAFNFLTDLLMVWLNPRLKLE